MVFNFIEELNKLGLKKYESEAEDREPIDFSIANDEDNVAWVYGTYQTVAVDNKRYEHDVRVECDHPEEALDWGDDDECGECLLCGAQCLWHWEEGEEYEGIDDDGYVVSSKHSDRVIDEWHPTDNKGLIGKYLDQLREEF